MRATLKSQCRVHTERLTAFPRARTEVLQRKCACGGTPGPTGECEACRKKRLQRKIDNREPNESDAPPIVHDVLRSPGQALDLQTRAFMEPRFGHNFANVRVHSDARAAESARAVNANAYTVGRDIVFGNGRYCANQRDGQRLLAHELTHVVQQRGQPLATAGDLATNSPGDSFEHEADAAAEQVIAARSTSSIARTTAGPWLQRKEGEEKDEPGDAPIPLQDKPKEAPKGKPDEPPKDKPKETPKGSPAASVPCGAKSLADTITASDKRLNGSAVVASLGADEFGNTSKLGADFKFGACKVGTAWRFYLDALVVPIASKVQPTDFRKDIGSASSTEVTKASYADIISDLAPTNTVTFSVTCGNNKDKDKVTTYSTRKTYWNQQFVTDHEAFHRKDWVDMYKKELAKAETDVQAHSIPEADAKDAAAAVAKANPELTKYMTDAYQRLCAAFNPGKESRAYDAGAPAYKKLVDDIKARAKKEKW
jgi:hypothetical protein